MAKFNVIVPSNLGKTIALGKLDPKKWDIAYDENHFEFVEGAGLKLKDSVLKPLRDAGIVSGAVEGTQLILNKADGNKISIPVGSIIPAAKADKFLKAVSYNTSTQKLVFTVGNDLDAVTESVEVSVADLIPVTTGFGLEGKGTTAEPVKVKVGEGSPLKATADGLVLDTDNLVELVDGTGDVSLGYIIKKA